MKQEILDRINDPTYQPQQIAIWLEEVDEEQRKELKRVLNEMIKNYEIALDAKQRIVYPRSQGIVKGKLRVNAKGFGFCENELESVYISRDHMEDAMDKDEVIVQILDFEAGGDEGKVVKILTHGTKFIVGTIRRKGVQIYFLPDREMHSRKIMIRDLQQSKLADNTKVQVEIVGYGKTLDCKIIEVIGNKYDPGVDIQSLLLEYDIDIEFNQAVMKQAEQTAIVVEEKDKKDRRDLRDTLIITIDGEDARDLDDAISIKRIEEGYELGVHIADVSYYVREGSAIDREAFRRGTSVYVVDRVVPMLPQLLSNGICSLNPKEERLTISCVMKIDKDGNTITSEIFPSLIQTAERMTYTAVNKIISGDKKTMDKYPHLIEMIQLMKETSDKIGRHRRAQGAIDFDTKEAKVIVNQKGKPTGIEVIQRGRSEHIIEDFMIAANEAVASYVKWLGIPSIYRVHESPEPKKIRDFSKVARSLGYTYKGSATTVHPKQFQQLLLNAKQSENYDVLAMNLLRSMQKAHYDTKPLGHFGLALEDYLHFTSPIRRYPDLMVHRMLRKYLFLQQSDEKDIVNMVEAAKESSIRERKAIDAERAVDDMKKAEYMEKFVGQIFVGKVSSVTKFGFFVELENTIEGLVHISTLFDDHYIYNEEFRTLVGQRTARMFKMGDVVKVRCTLADKYKRQIDFEIVGKKKYNKSSQRHGSVRQGKSYGRSYKERKERNRTYKSKRPKR